MKGFVIIWCAVFCLASCQEVNSKQKSSLDTSKLSSFNIDFLNSNLWLSPNYVGYTYDELYEVAKIEDNDAINFLLQLSKEYQNQKMKPTYFQDRLVPENIIVILPMPYQVMDKQTASIWISTMVNDIKQNDHLQEKTTEVVEKKIKSFSGHQMIKFKTKQIFHNTDKKRFYSQYYITGNFKSFMVLHIDIHDNDIEDSLKTLSLGSK